MSKRKIEHRINLINLYLKQIKGESEFMKIVLKKAIEKLRNYVDPHKVENWVTKLENTWRYFQ